MEQRAADPKTAPRRDMPRLHYQGQFNLDELPVLELGPELRAYAAAPGFKALASRPMDGRFKTITNAVSSADAARRALVDCNADGSPWPCFLYASGDQALLPKRRTKPR